MAVTQSDSVELSLEVPQQAGAGVEIPMTIRVVNTSGRRLDLYLRGRDIAFDLVIANTDGEIVWRRLSGEVIQAIMRIETLEPGATLVLSAAWDQRTSEGARVVPGRYAVRGEVLTEGDPLVTPDVPLHIARG